MKIWITRDVTDSIHAGGLERLHVWFQKPTYHYAVNSFSEMGNLPFGNDMEGLDRWGWSCFRQNHKYPESSISFGKMFGYGENLHVNHIEGFSEFIWVKLHEHYGNTEFVHGWYKYEAEGKCKQEDFLIEIKLEVNSFITNC